MSLTPFAHGHEASQGTAAVSPDCSPHCRTRSVRTISETEGAGLQTFGLGALRGPDADGARCMQLGVRAAYELTT